MPGLFDNQAFPVDCPNGHTLWLKPPQLQASTLPRCTTCQADLSRQFRDVLRIIAICEQTMEAHLEWAKRGG